MTNPITTNSTPYLGAIIFLCTCAFSVAALCYLMRFVITTILRLLESEVSTRRFEDNDYFPQDIEFETVDIRIIRELA